jgi:DNA-binding MarR family transcriptional regulator
LPNRPITTEQSRYGLRRVAFALGAKDVAPIDYEEGRERLLYLASQRSPLDEKTLRELLPTVNQIIGLYRNDWNQALTDAGLKPRPKRAFNPRPGLAAPLAIAIYFAQKGGLPKTPHALRAFAKKRFSLAEFKPSDWQSLLARALREIESLHLPEPPPPGQHLDPFEPIDLNLGPLPPLRKGYYTRVEIIEWAIEYTGWLSSRRSTPQNWRLFVRQYPAAPPLTTMQTAGGLDALMLEGTIRGWRNRALKHDRAYAESRSAKAKANQTAIPPRTGRSLEHSHQIITHYLERHGASSMAEIARRLGVTVQNAHLLMKPLLDDGLVLRTERNPKSPRQRYGLATAESEQQRKTRRSRMSSRSVPTQHQPEVI